MSKRINSDPGKMNVEEIAVTTSQAGRWRKELVTLQDRVLSDPTAHQLPLTPVIPGGVVEGTPYPQ